jgi:hypothetical protein
MQAVRLMPRYHLPFIRFRWANGGGDFGRGPRTFTCHAFCSCGGERSSLCLHSEGRIGLCALCLYREGRVGLCTLRGLSGETGGNGAPYPSSGILPEAKSVTRSKMCGRARRSLRSKRATKSAMGKRGQGHARRALGSKLAETCGPCHTSKTIRSQSTGLTPALAEAGSLPRRRPSPHSVSTRLLSSKERGFQREGRGKIACVHVGKIALYVGGGRARET